MTLHARKSPGDSLEKIPDDGRAKVRENKLNSQKFDSEFSKLQPVNLSKTSRDSAGVHQRVADSL